MKVLLTKIEPEKNRYRWYRITLLPFKVLCQWGRIDKPDQVGQSLKEFETEELAREAFDKELAKRKKREYVLSENTDHPTMAVSDCPWCKQKSPQQMEGYVVVPFPGHFERRKTDVATRAKWWAQIDQISDRIGSNPDVILPDGPHAIALVMGVLGPETDAKTEDKKTSRPGSRASKNGHQLEIIWPEDV